MSSVDEAPVEAQQCLEGLEDDRTIFRHPKDREHPYVMIAKAAVFDNRVSMAARHLLTVMLCMPDDWDFNVRHLAEKAGISKSSVARLLLELVDVGYVRRVQDRADGKFHHARYAVFESPSKPAPPCPTSGTRLHRVPLPGHGSTVSQNTVNGDLGHTDTPDPETEYKETEKGAPAVEPTEQEAEPDDGHLPPNMQLAVAWYKRLAKKTGKLISPGGDDFLAAQKTVDRADLPTLLALIEPYFAGDWWFTKHKVTKRTTYAFGGFLKNFTEMLEAEPEKSRAPPSGERPCPACGKTLAFGTGRFTRCKCGKAWEIADGGELEDVTREAVKS